MERTYLKVESYLGGEIEEELSQVFKSLTQLEKDIILKGNEQSNNSNQVIQQFMNNHLQGNMMIEKEIAYSLHKGDLISPKALISTDDISLVILNHLRKESKGYTFIITLKEIVDYENIYLDLNFQHHSEINEYLK